MLLVSDKIADIHHPKGGVSQLERSNLDPKHYFLSSLPHTDKLMSITVSYVQQVEAINEIAKHITNLKRVGPGLGEYQFNKHSMS